MHKQSSPVDLLQCLKTALCPILSGTLWHIVLNVQGLQTTAVITESFNTRIAACMQQDKLASAYLRLYAQDQQASTVLCWGHQIMNVRPPVSYGMAALSVSQVPGMPATEHMCGWRTAYTALCAYHGLFDGLLSLFSAQNLIYFHLFMLILQQHPKILAWPSSPNCRMPH